ncbi:Integrase catalytic domain-containing protein [Mycena sanguinolenta]|uniref:Integrase catalytic domain-containing protein n=1 Tax=Mycena sanguinolenta TaxID=230812 RepID=A0A8H7CFV9_9AGAR|nr:Integrase catalytic domain-containing protein [Mycena sanguinolenta]
MSDPIPPQLANFCEGYWRLEKQVQIALRAHMGDAERLAQQSNRVATFLDAAEQHQDLFLAEELTTLRQNARDMQAALGRAQHRSADPLTEPPIVVISKQPNGKGTGRHRLAIDPTFLGNALKVRGPTGIAKSLQCSARTVRRRALREGLVQPGAPMRRHELQDDGSISVVWQSTGPAISAISNDPEALDFHVADILRTFPRFGREMISGALAARGFRVPRDRIEASACGSTGPQVSAKKWATFFYELEYEEGLCPDNIAHLWLLHHLFIPALNRDALDWADAWNSHKLAIDGERRQTPHEMFMFGLLEDGPRGIGQLATPLPVAESEVGDVRQLGIDWEAQANPGILNHLAENSALDWDVQNPFAAESTPENLSEVVVEPPNCPFTPNEVNHLDAELVQIVDVTSRDMTVRKAVWREALRLCNDLYN